MCRRLALVCKRLGNLVFSPEQLQQKTAEQGKVVGAEVIDDKNGVYLVQKINAEDDVVILQYKADKRKKVTISLQRFADAYALKQDTKLVTEIVRMRSHS